MEKPTVRDPITRHMTWEKVILAALLGLGSYDSASKSAIASELKAIQTGVSQIATSLAVVVSRLEEHERRLDRLEDVPSGRRRP